MKKNLSPQEIIDKHIESDKIIESVVMTSNFKIYNREAKKIDKITCILNNDKNLALEVYEQLLSNECIITKIHAATACLKIGIFEIQAVKILENALKRDDIGIYSLNAEMALKVWRGEIPGKTL